MALFRKPDYPTLGFTCVLVVGAILLYHLFIGRKNK